MSELTSARLAELREMEAKATAPPWLSTSGTRAIEPGDPRGPIFDDGIYHVLPAYNIYRLPIFTVDRGDDHDEPTRKHAEVEAEFLVSLRNSAAELFDLAQEALDARGKNSPAAKEIVFDLDSQGEFDETWFANANVHIERMNETSFWIGFDMPGGKLVMLNTGVCKGVWYFNLEEDKLGGSNHVSVQRPRNSKTVQSLKPKNSPADQLAAALTGLLDLNEKQFRMLEETARRGLSTMTPAGLKFDDLKFVKLSRAAISRYEEKR